MLEEYNLLRQEREEEHRRQRVSTFSYSHQKLFGQCNLPNVTLCDVTVFYMLKGS